MMNGFSLENDFMSISDTDKIAVHMGDGWCTFPDLDNFDSQKLLRALTLKEKDSSDSIWDPSLSYRESCQRKGLSVSALRQLEALFNLSQLLFGLSRAETVNYTFRDLQLRKCPHSFKKSGFKMLQADGRIDFYTVFEKLVHDIIQEGGLEVTLLIYKNPILPMVRQKCLDLISNLATVPSVASHIMKCQSWFLDHLLIMVRDGDIVSDKIPALSVLIRLLKVMLTDRMEIYYRKLVDMQYIDCIVDIFENSKYTDPNFVPFFIKFEFITMQSLTVILGDTEYSKLWSDKAKTRLLNYCMIVLLKAAGALTNINDSLNHIFYAEQHTNKHSLAHTIMTVTELLRNDDNMKLFYRYHKPFKQLIVKLIEKYGAKSKYIRTDPGISYALNHLMRVLYIKTHGSIHSSKSLQSMKKHRQPSLIRHCANTRNCQNEETKYKPFRECKYCCEAAYCSRKCLKEHQSEHQSLCSYEKREMPTSDYSPQKYRRVSDYQMTKHKSYSKAKKLSKFASVNENRLNKISEEASGESPARMHRYAKYHAGSFKEPKRLQNNTRRHSINHNEIETVFNDTERTTDSSLQFVRPLKTSTALDLNKFNSLKRIHEEAAKKDASVSDAKHRRRHSTAIYTNTPGESLVNNSIEIYANKQTEMFFYYGKKAVREQLSEFSEELLIEATTSGKDNNGDDDTLNSSSASESSVSSSSLSKGSSTLSAGSSSKKKIDDDDEIEEERFNRMTDVKSSQLTDELISDDEQERRSQLKVMKEFERTLNFVTSVQNSSESGLRAPQISMATLCFANNGDAVGAGGCEDTERDEDATLDDDVKCGGGGANFDETLDSTLQHESNANNIKNKIIINNSIDSHLLMNSFASKAASLNDVRGGVEQIDNEKENENGNGNDNDEGLDVSDSSLFNLRHYLTLNNLTDYKAFKKPLLLVSESGKGVGKDVSIVTNGDCGALPHESTPILDCSESVANARRKYLMAQLDLNTTARNTNDVVASGALKKNYTTNVLSSQHQQSARNTTYTKPSSNLKQIQSLNNFASCNLPDLKLDQQKMKVEQQQKQQQKLNLSQYAALTNASATDSIVLIAKTDVPKDIKKSLKDDLKKDKKNCVVQ